MCKHLPLGLTSAAPKNSCNVLQHCLADVKVLTSELNVKAELCKITHFKMSSVTSDPPGEGGCWQGGQNAMVQHLRQIAPLLYEGVAFCTTETGAMWIIIFGGFSSLIHFSSQHNEPKYRAKNRNCLRKGPWIVWVHNCCCLRAGKKEKEAMLWSEYMDSEEILEQFGKTQRWDRKMCRFFCIKCDTINLLHSPDRSPHLLCQILSCSVPICCSDPTLLYCTYWTTQNHCALARLSRWKKTFYLLDESEDERKNNPIIIHSLLTRVYVSARRLENILTVVCTTVCACDDKTNCSSSVWLGLMVKTSFLLDSALSACVRACGDVTQPTFSSCLCVSVFVCVRFIASKWYYPVCHHSDSNGCTVLVCVCVICSCICDEQTIVHLCSHFALCTLCVHVLCMCARAPASCGDSKGWNWPAVLADYMNNHVSGPAYSWSRQ